MAPVNFEKELQDKLRSREVQPRTDSWDRIEARLEADPPARKQGPRKWKYLVAASVVFLLGFFLLQESEVDVPASDAVVENPEPIVPEAKDIPQLTRDSGVSQTNTLKTVVIAEKEEKISVDRKTRSDMTATSTDIADNGEKTKSALTPDLSDRAIAGFTSEVQKDLKIPQGEWVALDPNQKDDLDNAEVDALLTEALQVIENKGIPQDTTSLNPAALLGEVESELDQTFREQILNKLKTGFSKVRTAVVDRSE